ncbi:3D-(3,5/4)-trihydroxycyclohexane-1,2-dione acylhydrolase (decyclizing), partial [Pseudoxanthomonas sp. KAs_5_3]
KCLLAWQHRLQLGPAGVCGATAANDLLADADVVLAIGTRLQDFTTGSNALYRSARVITLNVNGYDALKGGDVQILADARLGLDALS